ncbi:MAG: CoA-binding protein [Deltaproteobacteria bacterium]|nr:CoA-binding protein [Deltaproteobacteria bacterium]
MTDDACEFPASNPVSSEIESLLERSKVIAVVGLSSNPERDSHRVASYLIDHGYTVVPVNPRETEILGQTSYPDLASIPHDVDIVDIFRKVEFIPAIVDAAIAKKAKAVWMQLGLAHNESADRARQAGLEVVMSKCIKIEHANLMPLP